MIEREKIVDAFVEWFSLDENYKKSYDGLITQKQLLAWDDYYFDKKLFLIDDEQISESVNIISKIVDKSNDDNDWVSFSKSCSRGAPQAVLGDKNYLKFIRIFEDNPSLIDDKSDSFPDRNYFTFETGKNSIAQLSPNGKTEFENFLIQHHRNETKVGDIVFFSQAGDRAKIDWEQGLSAICVVSKITKKGTKDLSIKLKPLLVISKVLNKFDFISFFELYDIKGIGPMTHGQKSQPNTLLSLSVAKQLVAAIIYLLPETKIALVKIFGKNFPTLPSNISSINLGLEKYLLDIEKNTKIDKHPHNLIVYGAPGTGKSYSLNQDVLDLFPNEELRKRITFHPNYSYRNFVGSYKPKPIYISTEKSVFKSDRITEHPFQKEPIIEYSFEAGPLLEMFVKAFHNPQHNFVIVIEEINRANTAAVFGDVFQLLDRKNGVSEYPITLEPAAHDYLKLNGIDQNEFKLPANLYLWATMNNADQGVMPMDSAFKRRWSFQYMALNANEDKVKDETIEFPWGFEIKWNLFRKKINEELVSHNIAEDKLVGPFFLNRDELKSSDAILNKLLLYLSEDVLKYTEGIFHSDLKTFSQIVSNYTLDVPKNVFNDELGFSNPK